MQKINGLLTISASDLSNFLSCRHLTELDLLLQAGKIQKPAFNNPHADALQKLGLQHEEKYIQFLMSQGLRVEKVPDSDRTTAAAKTLELMASGVDVIVQATLQMEGHFGRADILRRVEAPSKLGAWSYEVIDTKLSQETKATSILQLCLYSDMLSRLQGIEPEFMAIVPPGEDFVSQVYRYKDFSAYYRFVKESLKSVIKAFNPENCETYPEPREHCDVCRWYETCDKRRRADDHLYFVANLSTAQRKELKPKGITTLEKLATTKEKLPSDSLEVARHQAELQLKTRQTRLPIYELLPVEPERGFSRLPSPSPGDIFFDLEGDPFVGTGGLEYLWGWATKADAALTYHKIWTSTPEEEKKAFEAFMDFLAESRKYHPELKVYHYAPYEPSALKRLMGRYGTREAELDQMLRDGVFVDLYSITRQALRAGVEKYSIKDLEIFFGYERQIKLRDLVPHKRQIEHALELGQPEMMEPAARSAVELYNQDDCFATYYLREWIESLRPDIPRPTQPDGMITPEVDERLRQMQELRDALHQNPETKLLGDLVEFYRRESKTKYWEFFHLQHLDPLELLDEKKGLSGLTLVGIVDQKQDIITECYSFPVQDFDLKEDETVYIEAATDDNKAQKVGKIVYVSPEESVVHIKKTKATKDRRIHAFWCWDIIPTTTKEDRVIEFARHVRDHGLTALGSQYKAIVDILSGKNPDLTSPIKASSTLERAIEMACALNNSYLAIQGPPGTGKSYTASHIILELISRGYRVGVTATSHKVITNLLEAVLKNGKEAATGRVYQKNTDGHHAEIQYLKKNDDIQALLDREQGFVIGATDFAWSTMQPESLDYLVIDEAGQYSLTGVVAIGHCTKNLILLGDGAQLTQPLQGSHPDGADVSALDFIVAGAKTLPPEKGVFLEKTYRLNPKICSLISELYYEDRLSAIDGNVAQVVQGPTRFHESQLALVEVPHAGNTNSSSEEVRKIQEIVAELLKPGNSYTRFETKHGAQTFPIKASDIKIIAPYNAQVNLLKRALPNINIGTVDKFQGQEAPVVIYSVTTSSHEEAPRGMDFLYSGNRLNVAVSRAECLFIMVASPQIFEVNCKSPAQMKLANGYARFREVAKIIV